VWPSFTATRTYKDGDQYKSASSFGLDHLLTLALCLQRARWQWEQIRQQEVLENRDGSAEEAAAEGADSVPF
jgi:hypothetical protein